MSTDQERKEVSQIRQSFSGAQIGNGLHPPKDIGSAVPEGFTLPWNTTRTLAQVWTPPSRKTHVQKNRGRPKGILVAPKIRYAGREE